MKVFVPLCDSQMLNGSISQDLLVPFNPDFVTEARIGEESATVLQVPSSVTSDSNTDSTPTVKSPVDSYDVSSETREGRVNSQSFYATGVSVRSKGGIKPKNWITESDRLDARARLAEELDEGLAEEGMALA